MKNIPPDLENIFNTLLDQESVSRQSQIEYQVVMAPDQNLHRIVCIKPWFIQHIPNLD